MVLCRLKIFLDHRGGRRKIFEGVHYKEKKRGGILGQI